MYTSSLFCMYDFNLNDTFYSLRPLNTGVIDIRDISFNDYSLNFNILGFPTLSKFLMLKKSLPVLDLFLEGYKFIGYNIDISTYVRSINFFRTLKTVEYFFNGDNMSLSFSYSSIMNAYDNSIIRNLSASYRGISMDTQMFKSHRYCTLLV